MSDISGAQEERDVRKRAEGPIHVGIMCHIWVQRIGSAMVQIISETLTEKGFELNPYSICVENKIVNVKQCTLVWYLDDNKMLHMEAEVVEDLINDSKKNFGEL